MPDVLGAVANGNSGGDPSSCKMYNNNANQIYRVVGGRKHVQKSEAGMQTESNTTQSTTAATGSIKQPVQEHYDWKQVQIMHHTLLARLVLPPKPAPTLESSWNRALYIFAIGMVVGMVLYLLYFCF